MAYANGTIPTSELTPIPARHHTHGTTAYLRADAAAGFLRLAAAFQAKFGRTLMAMSFYRPLADQERIFKSRYVVRPGGKRLASTDRGWQGKMWKLVGSAPVAPPGTSNHGWGTTVDFQSGIQNAGTAEHRWMQANGPSYGWDWTEGRRIGERWHWSYVPSKDQRKGAAVAQSAAQAAAKAGSAPAFPLPAGMVYGPSSGPATQVSGRARNSRVPNDVVRGADGQWYSKGLRTFQQRLKDRGWKITADGQWGPQTEKVIGQFKRQMRGWTDPLVGPATWALAWTEPVR